MKSYRGRRSGGRRRSRGQAMVEFALVIPIFLMVLCGMLDFGFILFSRMSAINAAREGARVAAMTSDPTTMVSVAKSRAVSAAQAAGLSVAQADVTVICIQMNPTTQAPCTFSAHGPANLRGVQPGDSVSVKVDYLYRPFFPLLTGTTFTLSSTVQMVLDNVATG
jgi:Flp pilus assembly protein TadG